MLFNGKKISENFIFEHILAGKIEDLSREGIQGSFKHRGHSCAECSIR